MALYNATCRHCGQPIERKVPQAPWVHSADLAVTCKPATRGTLADPEAGADR